MKKLPIILFIPVIKFYLSVKSFETTECNTHFINPPADSFFALFTYVSSI